MKNCEKPTISPELVDLAQRFSIFDFCFAERKKSKIYVLIQKRNLK